MRKTFQNYCIFNIQIVHAINKLFTVNGKVVIIIYYFFTGFCLIQMLMKNELTIQKIQCFFKHFLAMMVIYIWRIVMQYRVSSYISNLKYFFRKFTRKFCTSLVGEPICHCKILKLGRITWKNNMEFFEMPDICWILYIDTNQVIHECSVFNILI